MRHLKEIGTIVYLEVSFDTIQERLADIKGRGVVLKDGQTLYDLYEERVPLYKHYADVTVSEENLNIEQTVQKLLEQFQ